MRIRINHETRYSYNAGVPYALQQLRLSPHSTNGQRVITWDIALEGGQFELAFEDQHKNHVKLASVLPDHDELVISCIGEVETKDTSGIFGKHNGFAALWYFKRATELTKPGPHVRKIMREGKNDHDNEVARLHALSEVISRAVTYDTKNTNPATSCEEALERGHGVCQDHTHIFMTAARLLDLPARYVSGYLLLDNRIEQDASHAWAEVYIRNLGWVGFDVSNGVSPDERYVRIATGLDYKDAAPVSGMRYGDGEEDMFVNLQIQEQ
ncbi:MAG: transglutaminase [Rhodospirillaceae bacterium TMED8]|nr:transglutaminase [Magnetovibrio sp.]OUT51396.1 MAG: transglutaminase [Rhodospirillaceae bacterium TMED8]|tara:strand:+ start:1080 stop:1883 length:804 start_codon:yes stop_codon:yes gene_type:complete